MRAKIVTAAILLGFAGSAFAAGEAEKPKNVDFSFETYTGGFDYAAAQRGLQVYRDICSTCHALPYVAFRNLADLGYSEDEVKAIAAEYQIAYIDDYGETATKPGIPSDYFPAPFANPQAASFANNGKVPPDLTLIVEARVGGADYVYSLLTGYVPEKDAELDSGLYYNKYYPNHAIGMAQPIYDDSISYTDGTPATLDQMAKDVTTFLAWAAEPNMVERKRLGMTTMLFLIGLTVLFYLSYKRIWAPVKKGATPWADKLKERQADE